MKPVIITDTCTDLPREYIDRNAIPYLGLTVHFQGQEIEEDFGKTLKYQDFYQAVRDGEMPTTSQINVTTYYNLFKEYILQGRPIIYIGFSSALSGSVGSAFVAKKMLNDEMPDGDLTVIDSKSASLGQGLLVHLAYEMLKDGKSKEEIVTRVNETILRINHFFTVDSLDHLKRGGRISSTAAMVGSILNIKPILYVNDEGRLVPHSKVQGRKKSLRALADLLEERIENPENQVIAISHGDCLEDALYLKDILCKKFTFKDIIINYVGHVIGAHSGPGTVALFFMGKSR